MAKSKKKTKLWFKSVRGSYIPNTWQGALTYIPFVAYLVLACVVVLDHSGSYGYKFFELFGLWVAAGVVMTWLAKRLSS